jgi:uncharacterized protein
MDDLLYLLMLIIPLIAQIYVSSSYKRFKKVYNKKNINGYDVARKILDANGLSNLYIVETKGTMTDHYDPSRKTVRLSSEVYHGSSVASMAIAAHECGHAIQDKEGYLFLRIRSFIYPIVNLGTRLAYIVLLIGIILEYFDLILLGIVLVGLGLVFQIVTLPVEINASKRALLKLKELNIADKKELNGTKTMLTSAALTYLAGVLSSAIEVFRLVYIYFDRRE